MAKISLKKSEIEKTVVYKDLETQQFRITVANTMFFKKGVPEK